MKHLFAIFLLCAVAGNIQAQTDSILAHAKAAGFFEEIFVHTNKSSYTSGETIWLKTFLYDGLYPSTKSTAVKIQLVSSDSVVSEKIYPLISGVASGEIKLPETLATGRYFLRAISNALANRPERGRQYIAPVLVTNPLHPQKIEVAPNKKIASIKLFCPAGLVAGELNEVFVNVTDQYRQPMQVDGYLVNAEKDTIAPFTTNYLGIAEMHIVPVLSEAYSLVLDGDTSAVYRVPSSYTKEKGVTISLYYKDSACNVVLNAAPDLANNSYTLVAEYNYNLVASIKVHFNNTGAVVKIPVSQLPAGINRLALLNSNGEAVCTRFVYSANPSGTAGASQFDISLSRVDTLPGNVKYLANDSAENSLSVTAADSSYYFASIYKDENIINRFLLTGWFKQYNPAYAGIIDGSAQVDVEAVNGLLATQELLKPSWQQIQQLAANQADTTVYGYINLKGTVKPDGNKSLPKETSLTVIFSAPDSSRSFSILPLDADGKFTVDDMAFSDSITMYYKLNSKKDIPVKLDISAEGPVASLKRVKQGWDFLGTFAPVQAIADNAVTVQKQKQLFAAAADTTYKNGLPNVTVHAVRTLRDKIKALNDKYTTTVFTRDANQAYDILEEPVRPGYTVIDYLRIFGRNMRITESDGDGNIIKNIGWGKGQPYTIFVDEGRANFGYIKTLQMTDVALIKVFENNFIMADNNGPAIAVYLRKGADIAAGIDPKMQTIKLGGFSAVHGFINPGGGNTGKVSGRALLSTFYWAPNVSLGIAGLGSTSFYNINGAKTAVVVLQGMGSDGRLIYCKKTVAAK